MRDSLDMSMLDDALASYPRDIRHSITDSLACYFHNTGYALQGNTEANDVEWFARSIFEEIHRNRDLQWRDDRPDQVVKEQYRAIARAVLAALPRFQVRIAGRLIELSKVTRDIERSLRAENGR